MNEPTPLFINCAPVALPTDEAYYGYQALSNSLCGMADAPRKAWKYYHKGRDINEKVRLGNAVHHHLLGTAELFGAALNSNEGKAQAEVARAAGKTIVPPADFAKAEGIRNFIHNSQAWKELQNCQPVFEQAWSGKWLGPDGKEWVVKCKPDIRLTHPNTPFIIDLKTVSEASQSEIEKEVRWRGLGRQAAFYLSMTGATHYFVLAIETNAPYHAELALVSCSKQLESFKGRDADAYSRFSEDLASLPYTLARVAAIVSQPEMPTLSLRTFLTIPHYPKTYA